MSWGIPFKLNLALKRIAKRTAKWQKFISMKHLNRNVTYDNIKYLFASNIIVPDLYNLIIVPNDVLCIFTMYTS